ncbi:MAG: 30S ribosome-binding factor RbfA [Oscillospiraceae bacterium]|jgi:ribosome-binding factor A|nr:30S ribosome-binding factor RbfA [Oscillospiraceae bacterium]
MPTANRVAQVNSEIKRELSALLRDMKDPRVQGLVSVTRADTSRDFSLCKVYVSLPDGGGEALAALRGASGYLRTALGRAMSLRHTPRLVWIHDKSIADGVRILTLIEEENQKTAYEESD